MDKLQVIETVKKIGVVAVIRGNTPDEAVQISEACIAGGVTAIEVAFTTPRAHEAILTLSEKFPRPEPRTMAVSGMKSVFDRICLK